MNARIAAIVSLAGILLSCGVIWCLALVRPAPPPRTESTPSTSPQSPSIMPVSAKLRVPVPTPYVAPFADSTLRIDPHWGVPLETKDYLHFNLNRTHLGCADVDLNATDMVKRFAKDRPLSDVEIKALVALVTPYNEQIRDLLGQVERLELAAYHEAVVNDQFVAADLAEHDLRQKPTAGSIDQLRTATNKILADFDAKFGQGGWRGLGSSCPPGQNKQYFIYCTRASAPAVFKSRDVIDALVAERRSVAESYIASIR